MLVTQYRPVAGLSLLEDNPRQIQDADFRKLCASITAHPDYFEARPCILSDRTGKLVIIAGNMRYRAAMHLGLKEIPTVLMPGLTVEREREIVVRDNVSNGAWDWDALSSGDWPDAATLNDWGVNVPVIWGAEPEPDLADLLGDSEAKPATMKITFTAPEQLQQAEQDIQELLDRKYQGAYFSVSAGGI